MMAHYSMVIQWSEEDPVYVVTLLSSAGADARRDL